MNKKQAVKECKELWREIRASGLSKEEFLDSPQGRGWLGRYDGDCPLCELAKKTGCPNCGDVCPLFAQYGSDCFDLGYSLDIVCPPEWFEAIENLK